MPRSTFCSPFLAVKEKIRNEKNGNIENLSVFPFTLKVKNRVEISKSFLSDAKQPLDAVGNSGERKIVEREGIFKVRVGAEEGISFFLHISLQTCCYPASLQSNLDENKRDILLL